MCGVYMHMYSTYMLPILLNSVLLLLDMLKLLLLTEVMLVLHHSNDEYLLVRLHTSNFVSYGYRECGSVLSKITYIILLIGMSMGGAFGKNVGG